MSTEVREDSQAVSSSQNAIKASEQFIEIAAGEDESSTAKS